MSLNIPQSAIAKVLTIAGSDCSGGAGIQADLKTMAAHRLYGMSVVTALTAQNTTGVTAVMEASPEFVEEQIDRVFSDIRPDAVKIGMVSNRDIIRAIARKLKEHGARHIVADPVMVATSGSRLMDEGAAEALKTELLPLAEVVTPNLAEAQVLSGMSIACREDMERAARVIAEGLKGSVLVKGGHLDGSADDLLFAQGRAVWIRGGRVDNPNTHGTGCTLSSAIACNLAMGRSLEESVRRAKAYLTGALKDGMNLGAGSGPLNHLWAMAQPDFAPEDR